MGRRGGGGGGGEIRVRNQHGIVFSIFVMCDIEILRHIWHLFLRSDTYLIFRSLIHKSNASLRKKMSRFSFFELLCTLNFISFWIKIIDTSSRMERIFRFRVYDTWLFEINVWNIALKTFFGFGTNACTIICHHGTLSIVTCSLSSADFEDLLREIAVMPDQIFLKTVQSKECQTNFTFQDLLSTKM